MDEYKLFLITRNDHVAWDEYDGAVICAETPEEALKFIAGNYGWGNYDVTTKFIGIADGCEKGIVLASYNAG